MTTITSQLNLSIWKNESLKSLFPAIHPEIFVTKEVINIENLLRLSSQIPNVGRGLIIGLS